jgi:Domain of unknown function (DUF4153)
MNTPAAVLGPAEPSKPVVDQRTRPAARRSATAWPLRQPVAHPKVLGAMAIGGVLCAATLPLTRPGIGWLIAGLTIVAAVAFAVAKGGLDPAGKTRDHLWWGVLCLALIGVGTLRAAGWLFVLCLLAAGVAAAAGAGRMRTSQGAFFAAVTPVVAWFRAVAWISRSWSQVRGAGQDRRRALIGIAASIGVGLLLVLVFGALFAAADPTFAHLLSSVMPTLNAVQLVRWVFLWFVGASVVMTLTFLLVNPTTFGDLASGDPRRLRRIEWVLPIGALVVLFALFAGVQAAVLFGGRAYVLRTAHLSFADYARRGFWQLLVVSVLTLGVLAVAARRAPRDTQTDRVLLRTLLSALSALALLVVVSAVVRMWAYEQAYGFTRLRVTVSVVELWLGILFLLVIGSIVRLSARWLPRAVLGSGLIVLLGFALVNPDRFIAGQNVDRYYRTHRIDVGYLRGLSADAAPELGRLPADLRECALGEISADLAAHKDGLMEYNLGRSIARALDLPKSAPGGYSRYVGSCW